MLTYLNYYEKAKSISHHISLLLAIFKDSFMPLIFISLIEQLHQLKICCYLLGIVKSQVIMILLIPLLLQNISSIQSPEAKSYMNTKHAEETMKCSSHSYT